MSARKRTTASTPSSSAAAASSEAIHVARSMAVAASEPASPNTAAANASLQEAVSSIDSKENAAAADPAAGEAAIDDAPVMAGDHPGKRMKANSKYFSNIPLNKIGITLQDSDLETSHHGAVLSFFGAPVVVNKGSSELTTAGWGSLLPADMRKKWMEDDVRKAYYKINFAVNAYHMISGGSMSDPEGAEFEEWCRGLEHKYAETLLENGKALLGTIREQYDGLYEANIIDKCGGSTRATKEAIKAMKETFTITDWFVSQGKVKSQWTCPVTMVDGVREINRARSVLRCGWKIADLKASWSVDLDKVYGTGVVGQSIDKNLTKKGWFLNVTELRDGRGRVLSGLTPIRQGNLVVPQFFVKAKWCGDKFPYIKVEYFVPSMTFLSNRVPSLVSLPSAKSDDDFLSFPDAEAPPEPLFTTSDDDAAAIMAAECIERGAESAPNFHRLLTFEESMQRKSQDEKQQPQANTYGVAGPSSYNDRLTYSGGGGSSSSSGFRPHTPNSSSGGGGGGGGYGGGSQWGRGGGSSYASSSGSGGGGGGGKQRDYRKPSPVNPHPAQQLEEERVEKHLSSGGGADFD